MKKAIKIILPLFLVLVLLVVGYWFFFQARTDLTAQGLIRLGDWLETGQHYRLAINSFSMANKLQPQDADLALKLAQAYRNSSNFTQTERTLVNAIYASPDDTRLYVALSKVYVEQDKLMDAQQMLDNIANPTVLAELSSRRPLAPTISPEGGYYSEYITVSLEPGDDAACYFTTDGQYPSLARDLYSAPVELPGGETKVCAVAVDDEGLVSPAIYVGYTVAGVVEDVTFADPTLEHYVQELLHRGSRKLQTDDLWSITELELPEGLTTLEDLQYFTGLTRITGHDLAEMDFSPLASMPDLKVLELNRCALTSENLEVIGACGNLERLKLTSCGLSNITALGQLTALKTLDLWDNSINSIAALTTCGNLEELYVGQNALTTLPPMAGLKNLRILDLSYNALESVTPLSVCSEIRELYVEHNKLIALTAIGAGLAADGRLQQPGGGRLSPGRLHKSGQLCHDRQQAHKRGLFGQRQGARGDQHRLQRRAGRAAVYHRLRAGQIQCRAQLPQRSERSGRAGASDLCKRRLQQHHRHCGALRLPGIGAGERLRHLYPRRRRAGRQGRGGEFHPRL